MTPDMIREFGFPMSMAITFCVALIWSLKVFINHFMASLRDANIERKDMVLKFTTVVENHIAHNTQALGEMCSQLKEMSAEHRDFNNKLIETRSR